MLSFTIFFPWFLSSSIHRLQSQIILLFFRGFKCVYCLYRTADPESARGVLFGKTEQIPPPAPHPLHQFSLCLSPVFCSVMSSHPAEFPWSCCCCFPFLLSSIPEPCASLMCLHVCLVPSVAVTMNKTESVALPALSCTWVHLPCFIVIKIFLRSPWDNFLLCSWHQKQVLNSCFFSGLTWQHPKHSAVTTYPREIRYRAP